MERKLVFTRRRKRYTAVLLKFRSHDWERRSHHAVPFTTSQARDESAYVMSVNGDLSGRVLLAVKRHPSVDRAVELEGRVCS